MRPKNNRGGLFVKLGIALVVLVGIAFVAFNSFQKTARVKAAKLDTAVDAVTGSVAVGADGGTNKELKSEADGKVAVCDKIDLTKKFKENEILLELDKTELNRRIAEFERNYKDNKHQAHIELTGGKPELLANVDKLLDEQRAALYREVSPQRKLVENTLTKAKRMHELNSISDEDLRTAERALENIDLDLQKRAFAERRSEQDYKTQKDNFELELERMVIKAPSDGEITQALIWKGAQIGRGHVVGKFMSHARIVTAQISEESFGRVRLGQNAKVRLLTYSDRSFDATVSKMVPTADEAQRFTVFLDVQVESQEQLRPGGTGEVTITVDQHPQATMIPRLAVFDGDKVLVVKNGRVEKRQIELGYVNLTWVEVLKGISVGEHVIIDELENFRVGDRVRVEVLP
jgi:RND family efflux transporter MFP subunit